MVISEDNNEALYQIKAYEPGKILINANEYHQSLIVSPTQLITKWGPRSLAEVTIDHVLEIINLNPEIVLLGTGKKFHLPPHSLLAPLYEQHIGVECMDTAAACRTYVALTAEGRKVAAALLIE